MIVIYLKCKNRLKKPNNPALRIWSRRILLVLVFKKNSEVGVPEDADNVVFLYLIAL